MPDTAIQVLFPSFPATFASDYSLAGSLERFERVLAGRAARGGWFPTFFVVRVAEHTVRLHQHGWGGKGYYPMTFSGEFRQTEAGVVLAGHFGLRLGSRLWLCWPVGFLVFAIINLGIHVVWYADRAWVEPLSLLGVLLVYVVVIRWGQRARSDVRHLSQAIEQTLTRPGLTIRSSERLRRR